MEIDESMQNVDEQSTKGDLILNQVVKYITSSKFEISLIIGLSTHS
jgi:hypothetical protein